MNWLDLVIVAVAAIAAIGGYRLGFLARVASWIGLGLGLYLGARLLPQIVNAVNLADPVARMLVAVAILAVAAFTGQALGMVIGARLHRALPLGGVRDVDRGVGACVGAVGILVAVWILVPSMAVVPGWPARAARTSTVARWVNDNFPHPPQVVSSLRRLVGSASFQDVFGALHPGESVGPPPASSGLTTTTLARASASTVKVEGEACGRIQEGSGFAVGVDEVVTNAHVVAGEPAGHTQVQVPSGRVLPATVVLYDPGRDVAVLQVGRLGESPLPLATGTTGEKAAVLGHPGGSTGLVVAPASVAREVAAVGRDLYDTRTVQRSVFVLAAQLYPGDSGGPLVDANGGVIGVAFAIAPDQPTTAYALTSGEVTAALAQPHVAGVGTGSCLSE